MKNLRAGENLVGQILKAEPGGFLVLLTESKHEAFWQTDRDYNIGQKLFVQFVCMHRNRLLVSSTDPGS